MTAATYRQLPAGHTADTLERALLEQWRREGLFERALEARLGATPFVFFEGPPTANGPPGIHHVFSRTIKDLFCRHRHMRGHFVLRKAGWDTHGLPVEIEVEKQLGINGKQDIEALGVAEFNRRCRESVFTYRGEWERLSERIAYWLDYGNPYVTFSNDFVESVWWALKTLHAKGRLYHGHKILPYCPRCGTALSSHEVAQGYEDIEDPSVYVALELLSPNLSSPPPEGSGSPEATSGSYPRRLLVWTTTPWTLVSNTALAVHPDFEYLELRKRKRAEWTIILATARAAAVLGDDYTDRWDIVARFSGRELAGQRYRRPLDWVPIDDAAGKHEVIIEADFVSKDDGSGIVHLAPAFGADDYAMGRRHNLAFLQPVNARGEFTADVPVVGGKWVKTADASIIEELQRRDVLWKATTITHAYPHCWRCRTPLLYYARGSWFIRTTAYRDQMLARNARVDWHPTEVGEGRFGGWLENNVDWAISRDRYWGTPLPVWVCEKDADHIDVIGSFAELAEKTGHALSADFDPHKPYVDRQEWPCRSCQQTAHSPSAGPDQLPGAARESAAVMMRRVPEVIDTWFDSGSMPFAQWHFPFENREMMAAQYPADFIAEGVDQTRGWFYSLLAIATGLDDALPNNAGASGHDRNPGRMAGASERGASPVRSYDTAPYRSVVVNDLVLDADGVKMSKSRGNVVSPWDVVARHGADAVRLFLVAASQLDVPRRFDENVIRETSARFLVTLRNIYSGIFAEYANFGWAPSARDPVVGVRPLIDRWVLSRARTVEREADRLLGAYDATAAARLVMEFVVDDVSNWYVRQSRHRFYDVHGEDNRAAFGTLHEVLVVACRLLAPFAPFISDLIHRELTHESVHLAPFVRADGYRSQPELEEGMEQVRELSRLGRAAREEAAINVRRPLSRLLCVVPSTLVEHVRPLLPLLASELNVKDVALLTSADDLVQLTAKPNFRALGKKFGKATPLAAKAVEALTGEALRAFERGEPIAISVETHSHVLEPEDVTILRRAAGDLVVKESNGVFAAIDPTITESLRNEGLARELVSRIQRMRKEMALAVSDRIHLWVEGPTEIERVAGEYKDWTMREVLAREVIIGNIPADVESAARTMEIDGLPVRVALTTDQSHGNDQ
jgi:isoleucyl-tRNA synthetase